MANPNLHKDEMDRVYKVEGGGGGGVHYVECHTDSDYTTIQCELSSEQIINMYKNGEQIVLKIIYELPGSDGIENHVFLPCTGYNEGSESTGPAVVAFTLCNYYAGVGLQTISSMVVNVLENGTMTINRFIKNFS